MHIAMCRGLCAECSVHSIRKKVQEGNVESAMCGVQCADCDVQNVMCRLQYAECDVQSTTCKVECAEFNG